MKLQLFDDTGRLQGQVCLESGTLVFDTFTEFIREFRTPDERGEFIDYRAEPEKFLRALPRHFRTPYCWPQLVDLPEGDGVPLPPFAGWTPHVCTRATTP